MIGLGGDKPDQRKEAVKDALNVDSGAVSSLHEPMPGPVSEVASACPHQQHLEVCREVFADASPQFRCLEHHIQRLARTLEIILSGAKVDLRLWLRQWPQQLDSLF